MDKVEWLRHQMDRAEEVKDWMANPNRRLGDSAQVYLPAILDKYERMEKALRRIDFLTQHAEPLTNIERRINLIANEALKEEQEEATKE